MRAFLRGLLVLLLLACAVGASPAQAGDGAEWRIGGRTYLAGNDLTIDRSIDGALTATGETINVVYSARIGKGAWLTARRVAVEGEIGGALSIRAQNAIINGHVKGDVSFYGGQLALGPDARIDGDLTYYASSRAQIDDHAHVEGGISALAFADGEDEWFGWSGWQMPDWRPSLPGRERLAQAGLVFGLFAALLSSVFPALGARLKEAASPVALPMLVGAAWVFGMPILALMVLITIIGLPLSVLIMLLWPLGIFAGLVMFLVLFGAVLSSSRYGFGDADGLARRLIGVALATLILWIGLSLPVVGVLVWLAAAMLGIGATLMLAKERVF